MFQITIGGSTIFAKTITEIEECKNVNSAFCQYLDPKDSCWLVAVSFGLTCNMEPKSEQDVLGLPTSSALNSIISKPLPLNKLKKGSFGKTASQV